MAVANGFGKVVTSGSSFMYDTGDTVNSYKGKPGYNVLGTPVAWIGNNNGTYFKTTIGTTTVNIPAIGTREVSFVDILNNYPNSNNCCPSLYRYGDWGITTGVTGNTLYTYSIIYKTNSGYTHPNFMYRYEFNGGSYITEVGVFDNAKRIDLGDGWYQAYNTFTTNASTNTLYLGMWYYQYNVQDTVYLYKASLTQGNHVFPPEQFIPPSTTRSATQGLLPVVSDSSLNISTVSFDSNAQMYFDGTDDYFDVPNNSTLQIADNITIEAIIKVNSSNIGDVKVLANKYHSVGWELILGSSGEFVLGGRNGDGQYYSSNSGVVIADNTYHHIVAIKSGLLWQTYVDGNLKSSITANSIGTLSNSGDVQIGREGTYYYPAMHLPIFKIYNRALTLSEVKQNYNKYKTRFNLP